MFIKYSKNSYRLWYVHCI